MYVYVCVPAYVCMCVCVHIWIYVCLYVYLSVCNWVYMCMCVTSCLFTCVSVYICVFMAVCVCVPVDIPRMDTTLYYFILYFCDKIFQLFGTHWTFLTGWLRTHVIQVTQPFIYGGVIGVNPYIRLPGRRMDI